MGTAGAKVSSTPRSYSLGFYPLRFHLPQSTFLFCSFIAEQKASTNALNVRASSPKTMSKRNPRRRRRLAANPSRQTRWGKVRVEARHRATRPLVQPRLPEEVRTLPMAVVLLLPPPGQQLRQLRQLLLLPTTIAPPSRTPLPNLPLVLSH